MPRRKSISLQAAKERDGTQGEPPDPSAKKQKTEESAAVCSQPISTTVQTSEDDTVTVQASLSDGGQVDQGAAALVTISDAPATVTQGFQPVTMVTTVGQDEDAMSSQDEGQLHVVEFIEEIVDLKQEGDEVDDPQAEVNDPKATKLDALCEAAHSELQSLTHIVPKAEPVTVEQDGKNVRVIAIPVNSPQPSTTMVSRIAPPRAQQYIIHQPPQPPLVLPQTQQTLTVIKPETSEPMTPSTKQLVTLALVQTPTAIKGFNLQALHDQGVRVVYAAESAPTQLAVGSQEGGATITTIQSVPSTAGRKRKHPQKPGKHICPYCSKGCTKPSVLQKHIRAHTGERPYPCPPCGISFKTKSNLYKHCKSRAHVLRAGIVATNEEAAKLLRQASTTSSIGGEEDDGDSDISEGESEETGEAMVSVGDIMGREPKPIILQTVPSTGGALKQVVQLIPAAASGSHAGPAVYVTEKKMYDVAYMNKDGVVVRTESVTSPPAVATQSQSKEGIPRPLMVVKTIDPAGLTVRSMESAGVTVRPMESAGVTVRSMESAGVTVRPVESAGVTVRPMESAGLTVRNLLTTPETPLFSSPGTAPAMYVLSPPAVSTPATPGVIVQSIHGSQPAVVSALTSPLTSPLSSPPTNVNIASPDKQEVDGAGVKLTSTIEKYADKSMKVTIQLPKPQAATISSLTPEKVGERISWLISNNAAIVDTPMADAPRPKRVSRQNSEPAPYVQVHSVAPPLSARILPHQSSLPTEMKSPQVQPQNPLISAAAAAPNSDGLPKPQPHFLELAEPSDQPPGLSLAARQHSRVLPSSGLSASQATNREDEEEDGGGGGDDPAGKTPPKSAAPEEITIQFHLPKPAGESGGVAASPNVTSAGGMVTSSQYVTSPGSTTTMTSLPGTITLASLRGAVTSLGGTVTSLGGTVTSLGGTVASSLGANVLTQSMIGHPFVKFPGQPVIITQDGQQLILRDTPDTHSPEGATVKDLLLKGRQTTPTTPSIVLTPSISNTRLQHKEGTIIIGKPDVPQGKAPPGESPVVIVQEGGVPQGQYMFEVSDPNQKGATLQPKRGRPKGSKNRPKMATPKPDTAPPTALGISPLALAVPTAPTRTSLSLALQSASLPTAPTPRVLSPNERPQLKLRMPQSAAKVQDVSTPWTSGVMDSPGMSSSTPTPDWKLKLKGRLLMKRSMSVERMLSKEKELERDRELATRVQHSAYQINLLRRAESLDETAIKRRRMLQHQPYSVDETRDAIREEDDMETETAVLHLKNEKDDQVAEPTNNTEIVITNEETGQVTVIQDGKPVIEVTSEPPASRLKLPASKTLTAAEIDLIVELMQQGNFPPTNVGLEALVPGLPTTARLGPLDGDQCYLPLSAILQTGNRKVLGMLQLRSEEEEPTTEGSPPKKPADDNEHSPIITQVESTAGKAETSRAADTENKDEVAPNKESPEVTTPKVTTTPQVMTPDKDAKVTTPANKVITPSDEMVIVKCGDQTVSVPENLQDRAVVALLLLGHSYASLRSNSHVSFCSVMKPQPMYVRQGSNHKISMYSNWRRASFNPNPMQMSSKQMLDLYQTPDTHSVDPKFIVASTPKEEKSGLITHSSYWTYRGEDKQRHATDVRMTVFPEILTVMKDSTAAGTPASATQITSNLRPLIYPDKQPAKKVPRHETRSTDHRVHIFPGGYKSSEDYAYIRGRGRGKYICAECGIRCKKPSMLKKHIRTHTDLRPYHCQHCNFSFKTKGNLTKHMKSKTHQRKCLQLGVSPIPLTVDDSQIDSGGLDAQQVTYVTVDGVQLQHYVEEVVEEEEEEEVEYEEVEDEEEEGEEEEEMEEQEVEEEEVMNSDDMMILTELPSSGDPISGADTVKGQPQFIALQRGGASEPSIVPITESGLQALQEQLAADKPVTHRVKETTTKQGVPHSIDKEIAAASLLDLSKGHKQPGDEEGVAEDDGTDEQKGFHRLNSLIGALRSRTKKADAGQEGGSSEDGTAGGQMSVPSVTLGQVGAIPKVIAFPATASNFKFSEDNTGNSSKVKGSGFVPPLLFSSWSEAATPTTNPSMASAILRMQSKSQDEDLAKGQGSEVKKGQGSAKGQEEVIQGPVHVIQLPGRTETITIPNLTGLHGMPAVVPSQIPIGVKLVTTNSDPSGVKFVTEDNRAPYEIVPLPGKVNDNPDDFVDGKYICNVCNKAFSKQHQLTIHKNIHFFERPWKCDECCLSFRSKGHLDRHLRSESHVTKHNVKQHVGVVTLDNPRPFRCCDCDIAFRIHGHLAKHLRSKAHVMSLEKYGRVPPGTYAQIEKAQLKSTAVEGEPTAEELQQLIEDSSSTATVQPVDTAAAATEVSDPTTAAPPTGRSRGGATVSAQSSVAASHNSPRRDQFVYHQPEEFEYDHGASNERVTVEIKSEPIEFGNILPKASQRPLEETEAEDAAGKSGPGPHKCGICTRTFEQLTTLKQHLVTHAELRPYVCEYCDAGFTRVQSLNFHLRTHTQERPYICGQCGDTFANSDHLHQHLNMHISQTGLPLRTSQGGATGTTVCTPGGSTAAGQRIVIGVPASHYGNAAVHPGRILPPSNQPLSTGDGATGGDQLVAPPGDNLEVIQVDAEHVEMQEMVEVDADGVQQKVQMLIIHSDDPNISQAQLQTLVVEQEQDAGSGHSLHTHQVALPGDHSTHQAALSDSGKMMSDHNTDSEDMTQTANFGDVTYSTVSVGAETESMASVRDNTLSGIKIENVININSETYQAITGSGMSLGQPVIGSKVGTMVNSPSRKRRLSEGEGESSGSKVLHLSSNHS